MHAVWVSLKENVNCGSKRTDVVTQPGLLHNKDRSFTTQDEKQPADTKPVYHLGNPVCELIFRRTYTRTQYHELSTGDPSRKIVELIFHRVSKDPSNPSKKIERILKVKNTTEILERFEKYRDEVKKKAYEQCKINPRSMVDGNELLRFYGTKMTCCNSKSKQVSELCKDPFCRVCRLIQSNFNTEYTKKHGIELSTSSEDITDYMVASTKVKNTKRAAIVCRIIAGRITNRVDGVQEMCDSIRSQGLGSQFMTIRSPSAILPCFVIVFT